MPYLEIFARRERASNDARLSAFVSEVTQCVSLIFDVDSTAITLFFLRLDDDAYAHDGALATDLPPGDGRAQRVFVKVHAYARSVELRRSLAAALTPLLAAYFDVPLKRVAVYFFERSADEVAHGGKLSADS
ncbi:phenylpyruvate tautomerase PptA (4-oxalocrotonate tautomerase family) [Paraburkholderia sp. UCT70]